MSSENSKNKDSLKKIKNFHGIFKYSSCSVEKVKYGLNAEEEHSITVYHGVEFLVNFVSNGNTIFAGQRVNSVQVKCNLYVSEEGNAALENDFVVTRQL